jgi:hypothetical protein
MVEETPELDETKGMATVGMAMGIGILTRLEDGGSTTVDTAKGRRPAAGFTHLLHKAHLFEKSIGVHRQENPVLDQHMRDRAIADEIAVGDIPHEQEQAVGHLVQVAVAQRLARQGAGGDVARLSSSRAAWGRRGCGPGWP